MLLSRVRFIGPTLDVASGWGILYPVLREFAKDMMPYCIAELKLGETVYDGERIASCDFECDKDILKFPDSTFGVVLFCDCLEHLIVDPVWTLLEFNRVLRPGGHLVIATPNAAAAFRILNILKGSNPATESEFKPTAIYQRHNREWTLDEVVRVLECVGFGNVLYSTQDLLFSEEEKRVLCAAAEIGLLARPLHDFGPELFVVAEKIEHRTLQSDLPKEQC